MLPRNVSFLSSNLRFSRNIHFENFDLKCLITISDFSLGLTPREYTQLQALYEQYKNDGLRIVAFPSNQFGNQEPGTNAEIKHFAESKYGVTFDMMAKTDVNGDDAEPVYKWMKEQPKGAGFLFNTIKWVSLGRKI